MCYPVNMEQNYVDRDLDPDPVDVPFYTGHSLFNTTKHITFVVHCSVILSSQSTLYLDKHYPDGDSDRLFKLDKISRSR